MRLGNIIDRIQEGFYSKGVKSDDSRLSSRLIYSKILSARAKLLEQTSNKKQFISQNMMQTLSCIELIEAEKHECPCAPPRGCKILRTSIPLPSPLASLNGHMIQSVTSITGEIVYPETTWETIKYQKGNKYTANKPSYFIRSGYLYITHKKGPRIITITAAFNDPIEAMEFGSYCEECNECGDKIDNCLSYMDLDFPLQQSVSDTIVTICINELVAIFLQSQEDVTNNSRDSRVEQTK
jgi:hypothetical protein